MLANVERSPCPCTLVPACALIQASVLRASTIGNRGTPGFLSWQLRSAISSAYLDKSSL